MKKNIVEFWTGKNNLGHIVTDTEVEMLVPIAEGKVIFADEAGNWFYEEVKEGKSSSKSQQNNDFLTV